MNIYFVRHGVAANRLEWEGSDEERPLTGKGKKQMKSMARLMQRLGVEADLIFTSPLKRALQTAKIIARELDREEKLVQDVRLAPGFGTDKLKELLASHADKNALMLVGHEPDFSYIIGALIGGGHVVCAKGGLARVDLTNPQVLEGELVWLIPPKASVKK
jgi:phosphohistidine phosphatase